MRALRSLAFYLAFYGGSLFIVLSCIVALLFASPERFRDVVHSWSRYQRWCCRNLLGITYDKEGRLWEMEMGPRHGDEINLIKPALNYGWPRVSNGDHYDGRDIPDHAPGDGFEAPKVFWKPAISPGGLAYYDADLFPQWRNSLFITGLSGRSLDRIALDGENATKADHWDMGERIRAVRTGPDGALWLLEDGTSGRMLKLTPKR